MRRLDADLPKVARLEQGAIDPFEFTKGFSVLRDEMQKLRNAIENEREYMLPEQHDPVTLLFDNTFFLGASVIFPEFLIIQAPRTAAGCTCVTWLELSQPETFTTQSTSL